MNLRPYSCSRKTYSSPRRLLVFSCEDHILVREDYIFVRGDYIIFRRKNAFVREDLSFVRGDHILAHEILLSANIIVLLSVETAYAYDHMT